MREANGLRIVEYVAEIGKKSHRNIAALATILSASVSYLTMLEDVWPVYNGIRIDTNEGWEQIAEGIDLIIDLVINNKEI